jgi:hypothetical protein
MQGRTSTEWVNRPRAAMNPEARSPTLQLWKYVRRSFYVSNVGVRLAE